MEGWAGKTWCEISATSIQCTTVLQYSTVLQFCTCTWVTFNRPQYLCVLVLAFLELIYNYCLLSWASFPSWWTWWILGYKHLFIGSVKKKNLVSS